MRVRLTSRAKRQIHEVHRWYAGQNLSAAERWREALMACLRQLSQRPHHWPLAAESALFPMPLHEITFGAGRRKSHRILFVMRPDAIVIYAVRHLAQEELDPESWDSSGEQNDD